MVLKSTSLRSAATINDVVLPGVLHQRAAGGVTKLDFTAGIVRSRELISICVLLDGAIGKARTVNLVFSEQLMWAKLCEALTGAALIYSLRMTRKARNDFIIIIFVTK